MAFLLKFRVSALFFLCALLVGACGYRFAGSGGFPGGVEKIFIEIFKNRTSKTGIERVVTNQLVFEFTRQRGKSLANTPADADAILKGVIQSIRTRTISRVGTEVASQREVVMSLDLRLIKQNGEIIWTAKSLHGRQVYDVSDQKLENDRNETLAIAILAERISQRIFSRLTDDF